MVSTFDKGSSIWRLLSGQILYTQFHFVNCGSLKFNDDTRVIYTREPGCEEKHRTTNDLCSNSFGDGLKVLALISNTLLGY